MGSYLTRHLQVLFATLGDIRRTPLISLNTILVIALSLFLPALLYITVKSAQLLSEDWQGQPQMSVFLLPETQDSEARLIYEELRLHPQIQLAEFVSAAQALDEFKQLSGLSFELDFLGDNPLPASVVVLPIESSQTTSQLRALRDELRTIDGIDDIRMDLEWTDRFHSIVNTLEQFFSLVTLTLLLTLTLGVGNSIKLLIINRRHEIEITKLVGGNNRFVRRPFLYFGSLFGFFGTILALGLLLLVNSYLAKPLAELADVYQKDSLLYGLNISEILIFIAFGTLLGWVSARIALARHLRAIRPK